MNDTELLDGLEAALKTRKVPFGIIFDSFGNCAVATMTIAPHQHQPGIVHAMAEQGSWQEGLRAALEMFLAGNTKGK